MLATPGAKVSVGVAAGFIASLNVTALAEGVGAASASVITSRSPITTVTVGLTVSIATVSVAPVADVADQVAVGPTVTVTGAGAKASLAVNVAVQVMPPSLADSVPSVPPRPQRRRWRSPSPPR